jgi:hypothetical protein
MKDLIGGFGAGIIVGVIITLVIFVTLEFTPQVHHKEVLQAESICKNGEWKYITKNTIMCKDGARYNLIEGK